MEETESMVYQEIYKNLKMYYSEYDTFIITSKGLYYSTKRYSNNTKQYGKTKKPSKKPKKQLEENKDDEMCFKNCRQFLEYLYKKVKKDEQFNMDNFIAEGTKNIIEASRGYIRRFLYKDIKKDFLFMFFNGMPDENSNIYLLKSTKKLEEKIKKEKNIGGEDLESIEKISQLAQCMGLLKGNGQEPKDVDMSTYFTCKHLGEFEKMKRVTLESNKSTRFNIYHLVIVNKDKKVSISDPFSLMSDKQFIRRYYTSYIYRLYMKYKSDEKYYNILKYNLNVIFNIKNNDNSNDILKKKLIFGIGFYSKSPDEQNLQNWKEIYLNLYKLLLSVRNDVLYKLHSINISPSIPKDEKLDYLKIQLKDKYPRIMNQFNHSYASNGYYNDGIQSMLSSNSENVALTPPYFNNKNPLLVSYPTGTNLDNLYQSNALCNYDNLKFNAVPFSATDIHGNDPVNLESNTVPFSATDIHGNDPVNLESNTVPFSNTTVIVPSNDPENLKSTSEIDYSRINYLMNNL